MLQYSPPLFRTGAVISILGLAAFAVLGAIAVRSSRQVYEL
jgi:uncharacterized membrane protein YfhO